MILIAYLNENFPNCNENLGLGKSDPAFIPIYFGTSQASEVSQYFISHSFHVVTI